MGHVYHFPVQEHIGGPLTENFSEAIRLWCWVLITLCAHSPPTLYFSCLCLCSSLVFLCLPFMSVFVPYHSGTLSACHAAPSPHGNVLFGQAHLLAYVCWHLFMFTTTNWEQRADVRRNSGRKEKGEWVHRHSAIIKWWHSKLLTNIRSLVIGKGKLQSLIRRIRKNG